MAGTALIFAYLSCRNVIGPRELSLEIQKTAAFFEAREGESPPARARDQKHNSAQNNSQPRSG